MSNTVIELAASTENVVRVERHGQFIALNEADALDLGDINTARLSTLPDREHGSIGKFDGP